MSIFNFIETFFFISLGITFVLISLLVYHFRQRIIVLESKNDTMFEIINNIVKELTNVRNSILYMNPDSTKLMETSNLMKKHFEYMDTQFDDEYVIPPQIHHTMVEDYEIVKEDGDTSEEDSDEEDTSEEDSEDTNEEDSEDTSEDDNEDTSDESEEEEDDSEAEDDTQKIVVSLEAEEIQLEQPVKVINVNIESTDLEIEEINDLGTDDNHSLEEEQLIDIDVNAETVIVHKILDELDKNADKEITVEESKPKDVYKNMTTNQLKQLVITKGLSTNPSKLKKNELLQLLENSD